MTANLERWLERDDRKPLVLRGARQVGKTWLVRELAQRSGRVLAEINLERDPAAAAAFASNDPRVIVSELELLTGTTIRPADSLLFIDEIQAHGDVLARLRWFYEELGELPVVAAGSLLEFTLAEHSFSMPVGRVTFERVEPMSFPEYLVAHGHERLRERLEAWRPGADLSAVAHRQASHLWTHYAMVGGMPAIVAADVGGEPAEWCRRLQSDLIATYRADFAKYAAHADRNAMDAALRHVARALGSQFVYARVADGLSGDRARAALELLGLARVCDVVAATAANGLPLAAEAKARGRKAILLDVGLYHALLGTPARSGFPQLDSLAPAVRGQLAEQLVGQQLRPIALEGLHFWHRGGGRPGEIDFVLQLGGRVVPVEVKAGATGAMKSLHQFMHDKRLDFAVRCDTNPPVRQRVEVKTTQGDPVSYDLLNLPHYLVWNLEQLAPA